MAHVIGIDSSTQSTKAELRDLDSGAVIARGASPHPQTTPPVSEHEPQWWWDALVDAVSQLGPLRTDASAISVAGQQHGLVLLDRNGQSIRPAKLWNDTTSAPQADRLVERAGGPSWWAQSCGVVPVAAITISKLAWIAEHEPMLLDRIDRLMLPHDWLTWRLTGEHVTDRGDASGTGWFDAVGGKTLDHGLSLALDTPEGSAWASRVPRVLGPLDVAGTLSPKVATELGLPATTVVGPGTGDNMAAALGLGLRLGDTVISLGTSGTAFRRTDERSADPTAAVAGFCDATGGYLPLVCTLNATKVTDRVAGWLGTDAAGLADLALERPADRGPAPVVVPYFDGERTPNRPEATGVFAGLTGDTDRHDLAQAAHDGVVCGLLDAVDALDAAVSTARGSDSRLILVGGGARSVAYVRRVADLAGEPVLVPHDDEVVATGAAAQAAAVVSESSLDETAARWNLGLGNTTEPDPRSADDSVRARYAQVADSVVDSLR